MSTKQRKSHLRQTTSGITAESQRVSPLAGAVRAALASTSLVQLVGVADAQEAATAPAASENTLAEVVVTGSRIAVPNETSISPVTFVSAADISRTGVTRIEDLLNQLPQVFADQGSTVSNGSSGVATVDLRGLNAKRTLVLVNGQRLGPGDPLSGGASDINMIPVEMLDSIEVLTGGASSTYGADAVAGVVNFKLNDHFEGVKLVADAGIYQNHNADVQGINEQLAIAGDYAPPSNIWAGAQKSIAFIGGLNSADNNGNATVYLTYRNVLPILETQYSWSACTVGAGYLAGPSATPGPGGRYCAGSETAYPANFSIGTTVKTVGPGGALVPGPALYNFGALNYFQRPEERYTGGAFLHYDFNEHATVYSQLMVMDDRTASQVAPAGDFNNTTQFNCSKPFLSPSQLSFFCNGSTAGLTNPNLVVLRRNVEGGPRINDLEHTDIHEVLGVKGKVDDAWTYDATLNWSLVNFTSINLNFPSNSRMQNSLNVTGTAANPSCITGPPCVPWNIFQPGGVTAAALNYLMVPGLEDGRIEQKDAEVNFVGDLGKYNIQSPWAQSGLKVNVGAEYRDVKESVQPDEESILGDLGGSGGPTPPVTGEVIAREGYIEARMPLVEDKPFAQQLSVETGYRYSDYNLGFKTNTYKFGVDFAPIQDVRLRGSFARAVRAPNVIELYTPAAIGLDGTYGTDPCAGPTPVYSKAQCKNTGVSAVQYGNVALNPAAQYNGLLGGNPDLQPETALTTSFGIGFTPSFVPNFRAQVDYYDIHIENVIQPIGGTIILDSCATADLFCNLIHRNAQGSLWQSTSGFITDLPLNVGSLRERGIDLDMSYGYDFGAFGKIHTQLNGTYIDEYLVTANNFVTGTTYNCAGLYGSTCSGTANAETPVFHWRHRFTSTWETPWSGLDVTATWRYYSAVKLEQLSANPNLAAPSGGTIANGGISNTDAFLSSYSYFDLSAAVKLVDKVTLRLGCNNVLDKPPPIVGITNLPLPVGNGNTFPGVYDALGRYLFAEVTAQF
jgi:iron complex outermembrane recepter protein